MNDSVWLWSLGGLLLVLIELWLIINIVRTDRTTSTKLSWVLIVLLLPLIGMIAWGIAGPRSYKPVSSREHSK
ncbi:MAG TPA: PLDc N-terminal domain-containing protein [Pseudomonas sp.]|nr:PLDc N-terminal domain-containing protein [Pseudomonas sp.]